MKTHLQTYSPSVPPQSIQFNTNGANHMSLTGRELSFNGGVSGVPTTPQVVQVIGEQSFPTTTNLQLGPTPANTPAAGIGAAHPNLAILQEAVEQVHAVSRFLVAVSELS
jgi:hypothetical protein